MIEPARSFFIKNLVRAATGSSTTLIPSSTGSPERAPSSAANACTFAAQGFTSLDMCQRIPHHDRHQPHKLANQPQQTPQVLAPALAPQRQQRLRGIAQRVRKAPTPTRTFPTSKAITRPSAIPGTFTRQPAPVQHSGHGPHALGSCAMSFKYARAGWSGAEAVPCSQSLRVPSGM